MNVVRVLTSCGAPIADIPIALLAKCPFSRTFWIHHYSSSAVTAAESRRLIDRTLTDQGRIKTNFASLFFGEAGAGTMIDQEIAFIRTLGEY